MPRVVFLSMRALMPRIRSRLASTIVSRQIEVAVVEVGELPGRRDQPDRGEIQEREDARPARLGDEAAKSGPGVGAGRADVEPGRHAGARRNRIGLDAPVGRTPVDVGVQVDQPGGHDRTGGVDHLARG